MVSEPQTRELKLVADSGVAPAVQFMRLVSVLVELSAVKIVVICEQDTLLVEDVNFFFQDKCRFIKISLDFAFGRDILRAMKDETQVSLELKISLFSKVKEEKKRTGRSIKRIFTDALQDYFLAQSARREQRRPDKEAA